MSRRVPEFALVTGLLLGLSTLVSGLVLADEIVTSSLLSALVAYPFVAYAVARDDDPTTVMPPRAILGVGVCFGLALFAASLLDGPSPARALFGLFAGLLVALPPVAYAVRFEAGVNPLHPRTTVLAGVGAGVALLVVGLLADSVAYGAADALLVSLSAAVYGTARGVRFDARTKRVAVAVGVLLGVAVVAVGVARSEPLGDWLAAAMAVTLAPSVYYALTSAEFESGRRRTRR
ncbi:hypothetical protein [Halopelagius longus]|uniref:Uncharacterized protein n=1 Tax=Halopelagius longus TaxID=1236180 RepID=A0A1H1E4V0_9EURY|nr:hypothetical protein [Halopelagius longus]RDI71600.1 hypothetical protein DWB78_07600 [Halopelagius longus]SDQ83538.1 hypothetical protein SAMN05216278_2727 [Halopelagius longus]